MYMQITLNVFVYSVCAIEKVVNDSKKAAPSEVTNSYAIIVQSCPLAPPQPPQLQLVYKSSRKPISSSRVNTGSDVPSEI